MSTEEKKNFQTFQDSNNVYKPLDEREASNFIKTVEKHSGYKVACLEEIAFNNHWIKKTDILNAIKFYGNCDYSKYLKNLISK